MQEITIDKIRIYPPHSSGGVHSLALRNMVYALPSAIGFGDRGAQFRSNSGNFLGVTLNFIRKLTFKAAGHQNFHRLSAITSRPSLS